MNAWKKKDIRFKFKRYDMVKKANSQYNENR